MYRKETDWKYVLFLQVSNEFSETLYRFSASNFLILTGHELQMPFLILNFKCFSFSHTDPDEHINKKYRSELLLPTYLAAPDFDANGAPRYGSRRSLRKKPEELIASRNEIRSIALPTAPVNSTKLNLASTETLNASEKFSFNETGIHDDHFSLNISEPSDKDFIRFNDNINGSRLSLQESPVHKTDDLRSSFRGNSLDVLFEKPMDKSPCNQLPHDITIPIPLVKDHKPKKRAHPLQNGDLKKHTHLRYSNYFRNMRIHRNSIHYRGAMLNTHRYRLRASSCPNIYRNSMTTLACETEEVNEMKNCLTEKGSLHYDGFTFYNFRNGMTASSTSSNPFSIFHYFWMQSLLVSASQHCFYLYGEKIIIGKCFFFELFDVGNGLFHRFIVPYFYLPEYMVSFGYKEEDAAEIISVIGIFNTIGMIVLGWIGDKPWLNIPKTYAVCLVCKYFPSWKSFPFSLCGYQTTI